MDSLDRYDADDYLPDDEHLATMVGNLNKMTASVSKCDEGNVELKDEYYAKCEKAYEEYVEKVKQLSQNNETCRNDKDNNSSKIEWAAKTGEYGPQKKRQKNALDY